MLDEDVQEGTAAEEIADLTVLRARVRHLEMQQSLMDSELESMSDLARQSDTQLRCACFQSMRHKPGNFALTSLHTMSCCPCQRISCSPGSS